MSDLRQLPRYQEALRLFDMSGLDESWGMPSDPHAREKFRAATAYLASGANPEDAEEFLELVLRQYTGTKYRDGMRSGIRRIVRAVQHKYSQSEEQA